MEKTTVRPRYAETDQMGVVYHGNYFTYFEVARSDYFRQVGFTYKSLEDLGVIMPVLECGCKFLKPVFYDENIAIKTKCLWNGKIKVTFEYEIQDEATGQVLANGFTKHTFVDKDLKPVRVKSLNPEFLKILQEASEVSTCD
jgi:acyl-CoA thioester hydrolase